VVSREVPSLEKSAVGWLALACVIMVVLLHGKPEFSNASIPPSGIPDQQVALQMARDVSDVDDILGDAPSPDREAMRFKQYLDFAFIAAYASLYIALAMMFRNSLALVGAICGVAAAVFDIFENLAILQIVNTPLSATTQDMVDAIHRPSMAKWTLTFVATAIFAVIFLRNTNAGMRFIGICYAIAAALGFYGLFDHGFLIWAGIPLGAGLIGLIVMFVRVRFNARQRR
jgi:hypothetical protein